MQNPAFSFVRDFEPAPAQVLRVDRHYLLVASRGALRLEVGGTNWVLPPARAALIRAGVPIQVTISRPVTTASVLFSRTFTRPPPADLAVIDLTPLARALITECSRWSEQEVPLDDYALAMFRALAETTWALAVRPSPAHMPTGQSTEVRRALEMSAERLADDPRLVDIASEVGLASRSLARRFEQELGMTWRAAVRRQRVLRAVEELAGTEHSGDPDRHERRVLVGVGLPVRVPRTHRSDTIGVPSDLRTFPASRRTFSPDRALSLPDQLVSICAHRKKPTGTQSRGPSSHPTWTVDDRRCSPGPRPRPELPCVLRDETKSRRAFILMHVGSSASLAPECITAVAEERDQG